MTTLKTTLIQSNIYWQDVDANLAMFEEKIWEIETPTDVIILPEMFNTGFSMNVEHMAEPMNFKTFRWMNQMAKQKDAAIVGSYIVKEATQYYNRLYWVEPDGQFDFYDKKHLFRMGNEHLVFAEGNKKMIRNFRGWKIRPLVCYDLRFPVWSRNRYSSSAEVLDYDLLIYVANWPAPRNDVWQTLLKARSMENQCYTIGLNRTGSDGEGITYNGQSSVFDFKGKAINEISSNQAIQTVELNMEQLISFRKKFPAFLDGDSFELC